MAEADGKNRKVKKPKFDFFDYAERLQRQQNALREKTPKDSDLRDKLEALTEKAMGYLETHRIIGLNVALGEVAIENCRVAERRSNKIIFQPLYLPKGEDEIIASYEGLDVRTERLYSFRRSHIVHKLLVKHEDIDHSYYDFQIRQFATLPLEDTELLKIIESEE